MTASATVMMKISAKKTISGDLAAGRVDAGLEALQAFVDGAGIGQINQIFGDTRSINASSNEDLDFATGGGLTDINGAAVAMARIKAIAVFAAVENANNVRVTRPSSNGIPLFLAAGDGIDIKPGGMFLWMARDATGVALTADTADLLNVANSAGGSSVGYKIMVLGATS